MAAPLIPIGYWVAGGIASALGIGAYRAGSALGDDLAQLGDIAGAALAGYVAHRATGSPVAGVAAGAATYAVLTKRKRE